MNTAVILLTLLALNHAVMGSAKPRTKARTIAHMKHLKRPIEKVHLVEKTVNEEAYQEPEDYDYGSENEKSLFDEADDQDTPMAEVFYYDNEYHTWNPEGRDDDANDDANEGDFIVAQRPRTEGRRGVRAATRLEDGTIVGPEYQPRKANPSHIRTARDDKSKKPRNKARFKSPFLEVELSSADSPAGRHKRVKKPAAKRDRSHKREKFYDYRVSSDDSDSNSSEAIPIQTERVKRREMKRDGRTMPKTKHGHGTSRFEPISDVSRIGTIETKRIMTKGGKRTVIRMRLN